MVGCRFGRLWVVHFGLLILHPVGRWLVKRQIWKGTELNIVRQRCSFGKSRENFNDVVKKKNQHHYLTMNIFTTKNVNILQKRIRKTNFDNWHFLIIYSIWIYDDVFVFSKKQYLRKLLILLWFCWRRTGDESIIAVWRTTEWKVAKKISETAKNR